jgi:hypothetical protein
MKTHLVHKTGEKGVSSQAFPRGTQHPSWIKFLFHPSPIHLEALMDLIGTEDGSSLQAFFFEEKGSDTLIV